MIRPATQEDREAVISIYNQAIAAKFLTAYTTQFSEKDGAAWFDQYMDHTHSMFVYLEENVVVGWLAITPYRSGREALRFTVEISYFVDAGHRGRGIGKQLIAHGLGACRQLGYQRVLAIILEKNTASIHLLKHFGFEQWGYLPGVAVFDGLVCGHFYYGIPL